MFGRVYWCAMLALVAVTGVTTALYAGRLREIASVKFPIVDEVGNLAPSHNYNGEVKFIIRTRESRPDWTAREVESPANKVTNLTRRKVRFENHNMINSLLTDAADVGLRINSSLYTVDLKGSFNMETRGRVDR